MIKKDLLLLQTTQNLRVGINSNGNLKYKISFEIVSHHYVLLIVFLFWFF